MAELYQPHERKIAKIKQQRLEQEQAEIAAQEKDRWDEEQKQLEKQKREQAGVEFQQTQERQRQELQAIEERNQKIKEGLYITAQLCFSVIVFFVCNYFFKLAIGVNYGLINYLQDDREFFLKIHLWA
mgnify:CR=1 FL=1